MKQAWFISAGVVLVVASTASACPTCSAGGLVVLPGMALIGMHVGMVLPIFSGVFERWAFTRAGVERGALALSLQANIVATLAMSVLGCFLIMAFWRSDQAALLGSLLIVGLSAWVKQWYVQVRTGEWVAFRPLLLGSILSSLAIFLVPVWMAIVPVHAVVPRTWPIRHQNEIALVTFVCCAVIYTVIFCFTGFKVARRVLPVGRGFEVVGGEEGTEARRGGERQ